jgi:hypothetical protein
MANKKERQPHYIEKGMDIVPTDEIDQNKSKRRVRKPKMPARLKSTPRSQKKK